VSAALQRGAKVQLGPVVRASRGKRIEKAMELIELARPITKNTVEGGRKALERIAVCATRDAGSAS
jgi:hypothetical protein